jgi:hypothetical protein
MSDHHWSTDESICRPRRAVGCRHFIIVLVGVALGSLGGGVIGAHVFDLERGKPGGTFAELRILAEFVLIGLVIGASVGGIGAYVSAVLVLGRKERNEMLGPSREGRASGASEYVQEWDQVKSCSSAAITLRRCHAGPVDATVVISNDLRWVSQAAVHDSVLETIAEVLEPRNPQVARALRESKTVANGGYLDLRSTPKTVVRLIADAADEARQRLVQVCASLLSAPTTYAELIDRVDELRRMLRSATIE